MRAWPAALLLAPLVAACATEGPSGPPLPWERGRVAAVADPADNPTTDDKVELGRLLFYDPVLSTDGETACATCHSEIWGMGDGLARSMGVGGGPITGPGREGGELTLRNAPTLFNAGLRAPLLWDGRLSTLEDQARSPLSTAIEMSPSVADAVARVRDVPDYGPLFAAAFGDSADPVSEDHLVMALAAFERTLVSDNGRYDGYVRGDDGAMSELMVEGMFRFAEAGCADCHQPPTFDSPTYANRHVPDPDGLDDTGRMGVTGDEADRGAFRVPTLRNVRDSGPYFHDGSVADLRAAVAHELAEQGRDPADAETVDAITAFLEKGLVDRSHEPDRPDEVPSGLPVPLDGFRIVR